MVEAEPQMQNSANRLRLLLGAVAATELTLIVLCVAASLVIRFFADVFLAGGFHVGPAPKTLYSSYWEFSFLLAASVSCAYCLIVALTRWSRWLFATGLAVHIIFVLTLLAFCWNSLSATRYFAPFTL